MPPHLQTGAARQRKTTWLSVRRQARPVQWLPSSLNSFPLWMSCGRSAQHVAQRGSARGTICPRLAMMSEHETQCVEILDNMNQLSSQYKFGYIVLNYRTHRTTGPCVPLVSGGPPVWRISLFF